MIQPESQDDWMLIINPPRPPLAITAGLRILAHRLFRVPVPPWVVNWKETFSTIIARMLVGFVMGLGCCILLVPLVFWPDPKHFYRSFDFSTYDQLGHPRWIGWIFVAAIAAATLLTAASTRATVRYREPGHATLLD